MATKNGKSRGSQTNETAVTPAKSTWSTANYADFSFNATAGSSIKTLREEDTACPECGADHCVCASVEENDELEMPQDNAELPAEPEVKVEADEPVAAEDEPVAAEDAPVAAEDEPVAALDTDEDAAVDADDETLDLDLADLIDSEEDVVELGAAEDEKPAEQTEEGEPAKDDESDDEFLASLSDDKVWDDEDDAEKLAVPVEEADDDEDKKDELAEEDEPVKDDEDKKDELAEEDEPAKDDEDKKDELAEEDEPAKDDDEDDDKKDDAAPVAEAALRLSFKTAEVKQLFENNTVLTEEDKRQSRVLFESAIRSVAKQLGQQLHDAYQARFEQVKSRHEQKVAKQLDRYLSYVVEQWAQDNKVALQNQVRNRLAESFLKGFQKLCVEHYIDVPESKVNVVEALAKNVKSLKSKLATVESKSVKVQQDAQTAIKREREALRKEHKARLIAEASNAVTPADRGDFAQRAQTVKFVSTKEFKKDLIALREQYFGAKKSVERPSNEPVAAPLFETKSSRSSVDVYTQAADRLTRQS